MIELRSDTRDSVTRALGTLNTWVHHWCNHRCDVPRVSKSNLLTSLLSLAAYQSRPWNVHSRAEVLEGTPTL